MDSLSLLIKVLCIIEGERIELRPRLVHFRVVVDDRAAWFAIAARVVAVEPVVDVDHLFFGQYSALFFVVAADRCET